MSESKEITLIETGLASMDKVAAGIAELGRQYRGVIFAVTTAEGMSAAREARRAIREPRVSVEKIRKEAKAPILELGRKLDAEAARITKELEALENPIDAQIKAEEKRIEDERQAKIKAEVDRIAHIHARIADMSNGITLLCATTHPEVIESWIAKTEAVAIDESFAEFKGNAEIQKADTLKRLAELLAASKANHEAHLRLKAEEERLASERAEQEAKNKAERDRIAAEEAAAKARREEEDRKAREALAAEQAKQRAEADRIATEQRRERERLEAERKRLDDEEAARKAEEKRKADAAEAERLRAEREAFVPTREDIYKVLAEHYGVNEARVAVWFGQLALELTPRIDER